MSPVLFLLVLAVACSPGAPADDPLVVDGTLTATGGLNAWQLAWTTPEPTSGTVRLEGADGATLEVVEVGDDPEGLEHRAEIFGLPAGTDWTAVVSAQGDGRAYTTEAVAFETSPPPPELPRVSVVVPAAEGLGGFVVLPLVTFDGIVTAVMTLEGEFVWWRTSLSYACFRVVYDPATRVLTTCGADNADGTHFVTESLADGAGELVVTPQGHHDFTLLPDGSYLTLGEDKREVRGIDVAGDTVLRVPPGGGEAEEVWNAWAAFEYGGTGVESPNGISWPHVNSLEYDEPTGKLLLGLYSRDSVAQVDLESGGVDWELGGGSDEFALPTDARFVHPHSPRRVGNQITLVDAGPADGRARVVTLDVDDVEMTASLAYAIEGGALGGTSILGNAEPMADERLFVAWGSGGSVAIVQTDGTVLWQADTELGVAVGYAQYVPSLTAD